MCCVRYYKNMPGPSTHVLGRGTMFHCWGVEGRAFWAKGLETASDLEDECGFSVM